MQFRYAFVLLPLLMALSGCPGVEPGPGTGVSSDGQFNTTGDEFTMQGQIEEMPGTGGFHTYDNVTIFLYTQDEELITAEQVGTLDEELTVSIHENAIPYYGIIDAPDFWRTDDVNVDYYRYQDGRYGEYPVSERRELPIHPP